MVEAIANSSEDFLIDALSFKTAKTASYITNRRSVTFFPQGGGEYSTTTTKVIKVTLNGDSWLDPSTVRFAFTLNNMNSTTGYLRPLSGPWAFFRRLRIQAGGQIIEDIDNYNRCHEMMQILTSEFNRRMDDVEGFEFHRSGDYDLAKLGDTIANGGTNLFGIKPGQSKTVTMKLLSGILNQPKYLPLRFLPLTIELELVTDPTAPIYNPVKPNAGAAGAAPQYAQDNTSIVWKITDAQVKCDLCTLDNSVENSYFSHILSGKELTINYNTFITQSQVLPQTREVAINVSRAVSRLKSVFITYEGPMRQDATGTVVNGVAQIAAADVREEQYYKDWNYFYHPMGSSSNTKFAPYDSQYEVETQLQIGSKMFPEYPIRSTAEAYYQLKKTMGVHSSIFHSFSINSYSYRDDTFITAVDTENVLEAGFSGLNMRNGSLLTLKNKFTSLPNLAYAPTKAHVTLHVDMVLEIRAAGVTVYD